MKISLKLHFFWKIVSLNLIFSVNFTPLLNFKVISTLPSGTQGYGMSAIFPLLLSLSTKCSKALWWLLKCGCPVSLPDYSMGSLDFLFSSSKRLYLTLSVCILRHMSFEIQGIIYSYGFSLRILLSTWYFS